MYRRFSKWKSNASWWNCKIGISIKKKQKQSIFWKCLKAFTAERRFFQKNHPKNRRSFWDKIINFFACGGPKRCISKELWLKINQNSLKSPRRGERNLWNRFFRFWEKQKTLIGTIPDTNIAETEMENNYSKRPHPKQLLFVSLSFLPTPLSLSFCFPPLPRFPLPSLISSFSSLSPFQIIGETDIGETETQSHNIGETVSPVSPIIGETKKLWTPPPPTKCAIWHLLIAGQPRKLFFENRRMAVVMAKLNQSANQRFSAPLPKLSCFLAQEARKRALDFQLCHYSSHPGGFRKTVCEAVRRSEGAKWHIWLGVSPALARK